MTPIYRLIIVIGLGLGVGLLAGWLGLVQPLAKAQQRAQQVTQTLADKVNEQRRIAEQKPVLQGQLDTQRQQRLSHYHHIPTGVDLPALVSTLTGHASRLGLTLEHLAPNTAVAVDTPKPHHQQTIALRLTGHWAGLMHWLEAVFAQPRLLTCSDLSLAQSDDKNSDNPMRLTLTLRQHWQPSARLEASNALPAPQKSPNTEANIELPTATTNPFDRSRIQRLLGPGITYLGRISRGREVWAMLRWADGRIERRQTGEPLSQARYRLTVIEPGMITLQRISSARGESASPRALQIPLTAGSASDQ